NRDLSLGLFGARAEVRRADYVRHPEEWAIGAGLFDEHVERYAAKLPAFEPLDECLLVVDAAAGSVDQAHARLHGFDCFGVDEIRRFGREGRVDREIINVREHVADGFEAGNAELGRLVSGKKWIVAEDAHLKGEGPLGNFLADA